MQATTYINIASTPKGKKKYVYYYTLVGIYVLHVHNVGALHVTSLNLLKYDYTHFKRVWNKASSVIATIQ